MRRATRFAWGRSGAAVGVAHAMRLSSSNSGDDGNGNGSGKRPAGYGQQAPGGPGSGAAPGGSGGNGGVKRPGHEMNPETLGQRIMQAPVFPGEAPSTHGRDGKGAPMQPPGNMPSSSEEFFKAETAFSHLPHTHSPHKRTGDYAFRSGVKHDTKMKKKNAKAPADEADEADDGRAPKSVDDAETQAGEGPAKSTYTRSVDMFRSKRLELSDTFAGEYNAQKITWWETVWYNYMKYLWTRDVIIGKDRWGNRFTRSWYYIRTRHEVRKCHRKDRKKQFQPYGALPTDDKLWEAWLRGWRSDPPTIEECEALRKRRANHMGVHKMDGEEVEDSVVRLLASSKVGSGHMGELDSDNKYSNRILMNTEERVKEASVKEDWEGTYSATYMRGDQFYNEEEVENMRSTMAHIYRDREWQGLEMKRQTRLRQSEHPIGRPDDEDMDSPFSEESRKPVHEWTDRDDAGVPMHQGVADLTTPELEKLRAECDALEDERLALRKELGLVDQTDFREGREAVDRGYDPFQPPPTSGRWKPKCWQETWGVGGANPY